MKILIFLFAMITFILMAGDPRREDFETREVDSKKQNLKKLETRESELLKQQLSKATQEDSKKSS